MDFNHCTKGINERLQSEYGENYIGSEEFVVLYNSKYLLNIR